NRPSHLAEILATKASMPVVQPAGDMRVEPDRIYVIPPNRYLSFERGFLRLEPLPQSRHDKAIDHLFMSLAKEQRERAIGIILTRGNREIGDGPRFSLLSS
ncbi:MAG: hypothetical protein L0H12_05530, partial [Nitrosospira sp.]|nr:hypothetical protein [Nitrosospira sp.]